MVVADSLAVERSKHFRDNHLAWCSLCHFLSSSLMREFCEALVLRCSSERIRLADIFEYTMPDEADFAASWAIHPTKAETPIGEYLQRVVRTLVWQNDGWVAHPLESGPEVDDLDPALQLGR